MTRTRRGGHRRAVGPARLRALSRAPGRAPGVGSTLLNVLWFPLAGLWLFLACLFAGLLLVLPVVTIPFSVQCFKLVGFALWPFGRAVVRLPRRSRALGAVGNFLWFFLAGWYLARIHLITGLLLCATVVGIPLGVANLKMVRFAVLPFGKDIVKRGEAYGEAVAF